MNSDQFEVLWSCVSKLESQVERDHGLPDAYRALVSDGFAVLRQLSGDGETKGSGQITVGLLREKIASMALELRGMEYANDDDGLAWSLGSSAADDLELYLMDASDEH